VEGLTAHQMDKENLFKILEIKAMMAAHMLTQPTFYPGWDAWEREKQAVKHANNLISEFLRE